MIRLVLTFVFLSVMNISNAQSTDEQQIRGARESSNIAITEKNIDALSRYWMDDFSVVRGNGTQMSGKAAIIEVWKKMFVETPLVSFVRTPNEIKVSDDKTFAWEKGTWIGINTYSKGGEYAAMWRKQNNEWKLQSELFVALK